MLEVKNLKIEIGKDRTLIDKLSFSVVDGDKLAIIGEEGNGKSTLVKAIACPEKISSYARVYGSVNTFGQSIGYLEQTLSSEWLSQPTINYFLKEEPLEDEDYENYNVLSRLNEYITKFKLRPDILDSAKMGDLSGGERVKLQLIKLLLKSPDMLILDEPTNDLDIETLSWLEDFILNYKRPIIYISHDEKLLERTANAILHIEQLKKKTEQSCTFCHLTYNEYIKRRNMGIAKQTQVALKQRAEYEAQTERLRKIYDKVDHELNSVSRKDPHGARLVKKKMQSVKSQEKRFEREKEEFLDIPDVEEAIYLNFGDGAIPNSKVVCDIKMPLLKAGGRVLAKNINLKVVGAKHVLIVGKNGVGKTTFIKKLYDELLKRKDITVGYMPQNYEDFFASYKKVLDYISENFFDKEKLTQIRTFLACIKFTKDEVNGDIKSLSGGQKAKLYIAKMMVSGCSVLLLDEPTRNLSPLSNPVLREALKMFKGAIICVSHDRKFIEEVADIVYEMTECGLSCVSLAKRTLSTA